jgi:hypothetical protein
MHLFVIKYDIDNQFQVNLKTFGKLDIFPKIWKVSNSSSCVHMFYKIIVGKRKPKKFPTDMCIYTQTKGDGMKSLSLEVPWWYNIIKEVFR